MSFPHPLHLCVVPEIVAVWLVVANTAASMFGAKFTAFMFGAQHVGAEQILAGCFGK